MTGGNRRESRPPADLSIGLEEAAGLITFRVGAWHHFGYEVPPTPECKAVPPLGERSTEAVHAGHAALTAMDELAAQLASLREQVTAELRADAEVKAARILRYQPGAREPEAGA
jgi:hypothetical protein